jgi:hypothetical protein
MVSLSSTRLVDKQLALECIQYDSIPLRHQGLSNAEKIKGFTEWDDSIVKPETNYMPRQERYTE